MALRNGIFRPEMVGLRRRMVGLSQAELQAATGISQGLISKIEQGLKEPNEEHLNKFAAELNCLPSFFSQAIPPVLTGNIQFDETQNVFYLLAVKTG